MRTARRARRRRSHTSKRSRGGAGRRTACRVVQHVVARRPPHLRERRSPAARDSSTGSARSRHPVADGSRRNSAVVPSSFAALTTMRSTSGACGTATFTPSSRHAAPSRVAVVAGSTGSCRALSWSAAVSNDDPSTTGTRNRLRCSSVPNSAIGSAPSTIVGQQRDRCDASPHLFEQHAQLHDPVSAPADVLGQREAEQVGAARTPTTGRGRSRRPTTPPPRPEPGSPSRGSMRASALQVVLRLVEREVQTTRSVSMIEALASAPPQHIVMSAN